VKPITFREYCVIFPLQLDFTEDITIDEIKEKLFDYYGLYEVDLENFTNYLYAENSCKIASNPHSRKKLILKNLKNLVNEIMLEFKSEKTDFVFFGDVRRINNIFFNGEDFDE